MVEPPTPSVQSRLGGYIHRVGDTVTRWHHPMSSSSQQPPLHLPVIRHKKSELLWIAPPLPPAGFVTHDTRPTFPPQSTPKMLEEPWTILDMWAAFSFAPFSFPFPYFPINCCGYKVKSKDAKRHKSGAAGRGIPAAGSRAPIFIMDLAAHLHTVQHTTHHYSIEKDYGSFYWISWMVLTHTCTTLISSLPDDEWPCWRWLKIITAAAPGAESGHCDRTSAWKLFHTFTMIYIFLLCAYCSCSRQSTAQLPSSADVKVS